MEPLPVLDHATMRCGLFIGWWHPLNLRLNEIEFLKLNVE